MFMAMMSLHGIGMLALMGAMLFGLALYNTTYKQRGEILPFTNPSAVSTIAVNTVLRIGNRIGVAVNAFAVSASESVSFKGVHTLAALSTDAWKMGDILWWDPTNLRLTRLGAPSLWPAGTAAADKAVTTGVTADVLLNDFGAFAPEFLDKTFIDSAVGLTLTAATHSGGVVRITADACTVVFPTGVAGMDFVVYCDVADGGALVTVDFDQNEIAAGAQGAVAATKVINLTKATQKRGDYIHYVCNVAGTSWRCVAMRGIWLATT